MQPVHWRKTVLLKLLEKVQNTVSHKNSIKCLITQRKPKDDLFMCLINYQYCLRLCTFSISTVPLCAVQQLTLSLLVFFHSYSIVLSLGKYQFISTDCQRVIYLKYYFFLKMHKPNASEQKRVLRISLRVHDYLFLL